MYGIVKWFNNQKGYGFIYGNEAREENGHVDVLPEFFVHYTSVKKRKLKDMQAVTFTPEKNEKGWYAKDVQVVEWTTENDPRGNIACKILDEFGVKIPCVVWVDLLPEDMKDAYNYMVARRDNDEQELKRLDEEYEYSKVPPENAVECIAYGGYDLWEIVNEQIKQLEENPEMLQEMMEEFED